MTARVNGTALFGALSLSLPRRKGGTPIAKPEERLAAACADFLRLAAPPDIVFTHIPNEAPRHVVGHVIQAAMGREVGFPDLHILFRGQSYYVEFKAKGKKPKAEQLDVMRRLHEAGGRVAWVDNFDDFVRQMIAWEIVPKD